MVKIRLARFGRKNDPVYRIVVIDSSRRREGKPLEILGTYHPKESGAPKIDKMAYNAWIKRGAQPTAGIKRILAIK